MAKAPKSDNLEYPSAKPILKWAGGKRQMLPELSKLIPKNYDRYIEPFFGGGALYFHIRPKNAIIGDSNKELINLYKQVREDYAQISEVVKRWSNDKDTYYKVRGLETEALTEVERAARTLYLNKTCFNGLYRVNKKGQFNVSYGKNPNATIFDEQTIKTASHLFKSTEIICDDYKEVLTKASKGDFVFLDPPYDPVGKYSDFKRYTKDFFYKDDHVELRDIFQNLSESGCAVILTNSNSEFINKIYSGYDKILVNTRRSINSKGNKRKGEDLIIYSNLD